MAGYEAADEPPAGRRLRALRQRLTSFAVIVPIKPVNVAISEMDAIQVASPSRDLTGEVGAFNAREALDIANLSLASLGARYHAVPRNGRDTSTSAFSRREPF